MHRIRRLVNYLCEELLTRRRSLLIPASGELCTPNLDLCSPECLIIPGIPLRRSICGWCFKDSSTSIFAFVLSHFFCVLLLPCFWSRILRKNLWLWLYLKVAFIFIGAKFTSSHPVQFSLDNMRQEGSKKYIFLKLEQRILACFWLITIWNWAFGSVWIGHHSMLESSQHLLLSVFIAAPPRLWMALFFLFFGGG